MSWKLKTPMDVVTNVTGTNLSDAFTNKTNLKHLSEVRTA